MPRSTIFGWSTCPRLDTRSLLRTCGSNSERGLTCELGTGAVVRFIQRHMSRMPHVRNAIGTCAGKNFYHLSVSADLRKW